MANEFDDVLDQESAGTLPPLSSGLEKGEFDDVLDTEVSQQRDYVRNVIDIASKDNPEAAAERIRLSQSTGLPPDVVARNQQELKRREIARAIDLQRMMRDSPVLFRQMTDPTFTAAAIDDLDTLRQIEKSFTNIANYAKSGEMASDAGGAAKSLALGATVGVGKMIFDVFGAATDLVGLDYLSGGYRTMSENARQAMDAYGLQADTSTGRAVKSGLESAGQNLALLPLGLERGLFQTAEAAGAAVAGAMSVGVGADSYQRARGEGVGRLNSALYGVNDAGVEFLMEKIPAGQLFKGIELDNSLLKLFAQQTVTESWTEQVTTIAQDFNEWMALHPEKTTAEFLAERPEAAYQTFIATLIGTGVQTTAIAGINKLVEKASDQALVYEQDRLKRQLQLAGMSALRERSPEQFRANMEQVVANAPEGAPTEIHVDAEVLNQLGPEMQALLPETVRAQIPDALAMNATVPISMADVLTIAPGTELEQILNDNARVGSPEAPSRVEAEKAAEFIQQDAERVLQQAQDQSAWQSEVDTVQQTIKGQLDQAGRFTSDVNEGYARLQSQFFSVMASRFGITPTEMYQRFSVKVAGQMGQGEVLNAGADQIQTPEFKNWFGDSKVVDAEGRPLVVYHGSATNFNEFDSARLGANTGYGDALVGFHFAESEADADFYANMATNADGDPVAGVVRKFYLSLKNPLVVGVDKSDGNAGERTQEFLDDKVAAKQYAVANGHDGIIYLYGTNVDSGYTAIAFSPTQIKSATGNSGAFDPNILRQSVSTRLPTAKGRGKNPSPTENPLASQLVVGLDALTRNPVLTEKFAARMDNISSLRTSRSKDPVKRLESYISQMVDNLLWLHDQVPAEIRQRSKLWYDGAREIVDRWGPKYDNAYTDVQLAAVLAVMSPKMDWFTNVTLGERIVDAWHTKQDFAWTEEMTSAADKTAIASYPDQYARIKGKTLGELSSELDANFLQSLWVVAYDRAYNPREFHVVTPEGDFADVALNDNGSPTKAAWGNGFGPVAKAIAVLKDGSIENVSALLGEAHKVRNFYNNIYAPNAQDGSITADTHAVAAALLMPLSQTSQEVVDNFGGAGSDSVTGISGTYPIYAEAYRRAAAKRGILPREMQSITWEAIRGLFNASFKSAYNNKKNKAKAQEFDAIWKAYHAGEIEIDDARQRIVSIAGGVDNPAWWVGPGDTSHRDRWSASYAGELLADGGVGRTAGPGTGADTAGGTSGLELPPAGGDVYYQGGARRGSTPVSIDDVPGIYAARTRLSSAGTRQLGTKRVRTPAEAAQAMVEYLGTQAVERLDGLVTDKDGKPLAIIGNFKGTVDSASVYPFTLAGEAFRIADAAAVWFVHNHPSGISTLSDSDRRLYSKLRDVFTGSGIEPQGMMAIGGKTGSERTFSFSDGSVNDFSDIVPSPARTKSTVPVVERTFAHPTDSPPSSDPRMSDPTAWVQITSPAVAKHVVNKLSNGEFGVVLLDNQHSPIGFLPLDPLQVYPLREQGRSAALFRAISVSNAAAAIVADNGKAPASDIQNLASALTTIDVRVLDVIGASGKGKSWSEQGLNIGNGRFYQSQQARGTFNPQTLLISLGPQSDLSTFLHESGHFFLEVMADLAAQPDAPAQVREDMDKVRAWFASGSGTAMLAKVEQDAKDAEADASRAEKAGDPDAAQKRAYATQVRSAYTFAVDNGGADYMKTVAATFGRDVPKAHRIHLIRQFHERWAESFEQYLLEGKAPSAELQPLFRRFRAWLVNVYKSLTDFMRGRNLEVNDEIRQVFDRMLATDEQIAQAEEQAGLLPDFDATNAAIERLQERSLRNLKWTLNARSKFLKQFTKEARELRKGVLAEVMAEFEQRPDVIASRAIRKVRNKDGAERDAKIAAIADATGYPTVEEMAAAVTALGPVNEAVEAEVDRRMLERHGDMATQEALEAAANEAVHNEARARALAAELKSQDEAMNPRETTGRTDARGRPITVNALVEAARAFGADLAARRAVGKLKNAIYLHRAAEARAGKAWQTATKKGDSKAAVQAKKDQLLNNQAVRALLDAQAEVRSAIEFFRKVTKGNNEKLVKGGRDPDVVNAMRAILGVYGIAPRTGKTALEYMELVQKNDPAMYAVIAPGVNTALANAKPFSELTVEEVRGLTDELKSLWHLAKRSRQMEIDGDLLDLEDLADQLYARMEEIGIPDVLPGETGALTDSELRKRNWLQQAPAILRRVEQWAEAKDGAFGGPFLRFIFQPVKIAADRYRADRLVYRQKFQALVDAIAPTMDKTVIAAPELNYTFGRGHNGIGLAELLHAILHTGNDSNKRKLLLGRNWATENPDGTLDTSRWDAFIARLITDGTLTKAHYDFAQGVWDLMEETKPLAQKTHRDVFGRYFAEVTANEFQTPFGIYRGGYVPAQADPLLVQEADQRELLETENAGMSYAFPATNRGFTKGRVEYNRPLKLDLRTLPQHIDKVLLFSHMEPAVRGVDRLLRRKKIAQALNKIDPAAINGMLKPWLNRSARQTVETPVSADAGMNRMFSQARARTGMALMMGNLSNTLQQITGFSTALLKVKGSHMRRAVAQYIADPKQLKNTVWSLSPYMADRASNEVAVLSDTLEAILLNPSVYQSAERFTRRHGYFLQTAMDNQMSPIIWTGAYNQALAEGMEDRMARRYADGVIRQTQGSTLPEDVSRIETGTAFARAFTQFVGYFNMLANTNATALQQIAQQQGLRKGAGKAFGVLMLGMMIPIWVAEVIAQAFRGGPEDDEDDGYLDDWLAAVFGFGTIRGILSGVPAIAQIGQSMVNRFNDNPADDKFSLSPTVSVLESAAAAPQSVYKAIADEGSAQKAVRDMSALITVTTGLPAMTLARPLGYAAGVAQGKIEPTGPADFARGMVTGTASPESKTP